MRKKIKISKKLDDLLTRIATRIAADYKFKPLKAELVACACGDALEERVRKMCYHAERAKDVL